MGWGCAVKKGVGAEKGSHGYIKKKKGKGGKKERGTEIVGIKVIKSHDECVHSC